MKNILRFAIGAVAFTFSSAFAATLTWNLVGSSSQLLGTSETVVSTTGNVSMGFSGYVTNLSDVGSSNTWLAATAKSSDLFAKKSGGDETGLGLHADPTNDNEIFPNSFIQIDLRGLLAQRSITQLNLVIGSVQSGEGFKVWGSNTAGQPGALLYSGTSAMDDKSFSVPSYGTYQFVSVSASADNVLLDTVTAAGNLTQQNPTPEPGTITLGLIAVLGMVMRKMAVTRRNGRKS